MNEREKNVLNILWGSDNPMTSSDIVNQHQNLTQSTVIAVLRKLLKMGLVEVVGVTHSGKVLSRTYRPSANSKQYVIKALLEEFKMVSNIVTLKELMEMDK